MQRHTHDLVRGLVEAGHDVEVVCPRAEGLEPHLYGARWTLLETVGRSPEWPSLVIAAYETAMGRIAPDVIHSESTSALPLAHARVTPPIAVKYHGNYLGLVKAHVRRAVSRPASTLREARGLAWVTRLHFGGGNAWAFRQCASMVPSRQQLRDTARSHLIPKRLLHVVPNAVDVALFAPADREATRRALGLGEGPMLSTVGRLNYEKGFDVALEALARIATDYPDARLLVVGKGEEREELESLARRLGVSERADFVGRQPPEMVAKYLAASDAFLFPTRRDEAFGIVTAEAMSCGVPVVASRIGAVSEILGSLNGEPVGILVRPGSVDELESAVRRLLRDPALRVSLGAAARARAVGEYSLETMIDRTVAVYREAIASHAREREC